MRKLRTDIVFPVLLMKSQYEGMTSSGEGGNTFKPTVKIGNEIFLQVLLMNLKEDEGMTSSMYIIQWRFETHDEYFGGKLTLKISVKKYFLS